MAWVHVQTNSIELNGTGNSIARFFGANVTAGNTLIVGVYGEPNTTSGFTILDSQGNSYTPQGTDADVGDGQEMAVWTAVAKATGANTVTVDTVSGSTHLGLVIAEYSGLGTVTGCVFNFNASSSNPSAGGSAGDGKAGQLLWGFIGVAHASSGGAVTAGGGFTERANDQSAANSVGVEVEDMVYGGSTGQTTWSLGGSSTWMAACLTADTSAPPPAQPYPQPNQRWDSLPVLDSWWEQFRLQPVPVSYASPVPTNPQHAQRVDPLPVFDSWWEQFREQPNPVTFTPGPPALNPQHGQRVDPLPEFVSWWEQFYRWPTPVGSVPPPPQNPPSRQPSQRWDSLPVLDSWWEQFRLQPLPSSIFVSQEGLSGVYNTTPVVSQVGVSRVQNNIQGYNIYVGVNAPPNLTQPPTAFSATLPVNVPVTPPASGVETLYVTVTSQDLYGLQSQNQFSTVIVIDQNGNQVLTPVTPPQNLKLVPAAGELLTVLATYPGFNSDQYPATQWKVWAGLTPPNPLTDVPVSVVSASSILSTQIGPLAVGLWYIAVGLYRATDAYLSGTIFGSAIIQAVPAEVIPVPSGYQGT